MHKQIDASDVSATCNDRESPRLHFIRTRKESANIHGLGSGARAIAAAAQQSGGDALSWKGVREEASQRRQRGHPQGLAEAGTEADMGSTEGGTARATNRAA